MGLERPDPQVIVIFGASGDLTQRKAIPALYNLYRENLLPANFAVVGFARTPMTRDEFRDNMRDAVSKHSRSGIAERYWGPFKEHLDYFSGSYGDPERWVEFRKYLEEVDAEGGVAQ